MSRDGEREKKQDKKTGKIGKNITNVFLYFIFAVNLVYFFEKKNLEVRLFLVQYIPVVVCPPSALPDFLHPCPSGSLFSVYNIEQNVYF